ncbi:hypothetical protein ACJZ2D_011081 [Fusarium nematophilum]
MANSSSTALKWLQLDKDEPSDVFYSSVGAIIASTLLALHLNVPPPRPRPSHPFFLMRIWDSEFLYQLRYQLRWAIMVVIAPELLVSLAFGDWRAGSQGLAVFHKFGRKDVQGWKRPQANLANMGGLRFEMKRGGPEIPTFAKNIDLRLSLAQLLIYLEEQIPFNRAVRKSRRWWRLLSDKFGSLFRLVRRLGRPDKGKGRADQDRPNNSSFEVTANDIEMDEATALRLSNPPTSRSEGFDMEQSLDGIVSGNDERGTGRPNSAMPSNRRESIDLGQLGRASEPSSSRDIDADDRVCDDDGQPILPSGASLLPVTGTICLHLNAVQIVAAQILGILDNVPGLDETVIGDKSKTNAFVKISAMIPLAWFSARIFGKSYMGQHISQLELASSTYILCSLLAYMLYWQKPQGVERPIELHVEANDGVRPVTDQDLEFLRLLGGSPFLSRNFVPPFGMDNYSVDPVHPIPTGTSLTKFAMLSGSGGYGVYLFDDDFAGTLIGIVFGGLYCLGWNSNKFPSLLERLAWRGALVSIMGSLIPYSIANGVCTTVFKDLVTPGGGRKAHVVHSLILYTLLCVYVIGRLFMLGAMMREFFA